MSASGKKIFCCNGAPRPRGREFHELEYATHSPKQNINAALPRLAESLQHIPPRILDLLEIAVYVFSADRAAFRGPREAVEYHSWSRRLHFRIKVRDYEFWSAPHVQRALGDAIRFPSGDESITFEFFPGHATPPTNLFDRPDTRLSQGPHAPVIALFSGGLDSLAGAIELLGSGNRTILVSHESLSGTVRTQRTIYDALEKSYGSLVAPCRFRCNLKDGRPPEETQRTRAFLYCCVAFAIAEAYGVDSANVYENGVTSINLYRREDLLNARASRTTHPRTLKLLQDLFGLVAGRAFKLNHPFLDLTKRDIVERIKMTSLSFLISSTVSCTRAFRSEKATHCGQCFQCIDRRIASFAAGVSDIDHSGLYEADIVASPIESSETMTAVIDFIRLARDCARKGSGWFERQFASELADIVVAMPADTDEASMVERIQKLMKRHGDNVEAGIRRMRDLHDDPYALQALPDRCLLNVIASKEALSSDSVFLSSSTQHTVPSSSAGEELSPEDKRRESVERSRAYRHSNSHIGEPMRTDCLIITALPKELDAVRFQFRHWKPLIHPSTTAALYETISPNGLRVVASVGAAMGQLAASALTNQLLQALDPSTVLLVGIAGGMDRGINLGDVVAADQIVSYELGKVTDDGFGPRWSAFRTDAQLLSRLNSWSPQRWQEYVRVTPPSPTVPRLHTGVYLSGDKVIADSKTAGVLRAVWQKAAVIEMEAAAVASAIYHAPRHPPFLVLKAICDYADTSKNDSWQEFAADSAASCACSFVIEQLRHSDLNDVNGVVLGGSATNRSDVDGRGIRLVLANAFDLSELKTLCYDLKIDWDEIAGTRKSEKITELLSFVQRRNRLADLVELVNKERDGLLRAYSPGELA